MTQFFIILQLLWFTNDQPIRFEDFSTGDCEVFERANRLSRDSLPNNSFILEAFDEQWKKGSNVYACHYYVLSWGCGQGCQMNLIFDQRTGKCIRHLITSAGLAYRSNSKLLIAFLGPDTYGKKQYYIIDDENGMRQFNPRDMANLKD